MNIIQKFKEFFTPSKVKELEEKVLQLEQIIPVLSKGTDLVEEIEKIKVEKIISKILYNTNTKNIDIILSNGNVLSGIVEKDIYEEITNCNDELMILDLISPTKEEIKGSDFDLEVEKTITPLINILSSNSNFEIENDKVYLKGIKSIAIPSSIVAEFIRIVSEMDKNREKDYGLEYISKDADLGEEYNSLLMFTYKLLLNPLKESREQLLNFVKKNDVKITSYGNLVLYRACWEAKNESDALVKFVAKEYLKIKAWKKSPKSYFVASRLNDYKLFKEGEISKDDNPYWTNHGNLAELYSKLPEMQSKGKQYYSDHGKKKIVIGDIYKIDDKDVNLDANVCAAGGLHCASYDYDYSGFGDTNLIVLVNPSKTITVPTYDFSKMRVSEMMIVGINPNERGVHIDEGFYSNLDENYHNYSIDELQEAFKNKSFEPISVSTEITDLTMKEIINITKVLKHRVIEII